MGIETITQTHSLNLLSGFVYFSKGNYPINLDIPYNRTSPFGYIIVVKRCHNMINSKPHTCSIR